MCICAHHLEKYAEVATITTEHLSLFKDSIQWKQSYFTLLSMCSVWYNQRNKTVSSPLNRRHLSYAQCIFLFHKKVLISLFLSFRTTKQNQTKKNVHRRTAFLPFIVRPPGPEKGFPLISGTVISSENISVGKHCWLGSDRSDEALTTASMPSTTDEGIPLLFARGFDGSSPPFRRADPFDRKKGGRKPRATEKWFNYFCRWKSLSLGATLSLSFSIVTDCLHSANPGRPRCRYFRYPAWRLYWHLCICAKEQTTQGWNPDRQKSGRAAERTVSRSVGFVHLITITAASCGGVVGWALINLFLFRSEVQTLFHLHRRHWNALVVSVFSFHFCHWTL